MSLRYVAFVASVCLVLGALGCGVSQPCEGPNCASVGGGAGGSGGRGAGGGTGHRCAGTLVSCGADCKDTQSDPANCGQCGVVCGAGQVCNGSCRALPDDCVSAGGCAPGYACDPSSRKCVAGCRLPTE